MMIKREKQIRILLSEDEMAKLKEAADRRGLPLAGWVRMVALEAAAKGADG